MKRAAIHAHVHPYQPFGSPPHRLALTACGGPLDKKVVDPSVEPSAAVVEALEMQRYEVIKNAGGLNMVLSATGQKVSLGPHVQKVTKQSCKAIPNMAQTMYECHSTLLMKLNDQDKTTERPSRIFITVNPMTGKWARR